MKEILNMFLLYKEKKTKIKEKDDNNFNRESGYMFIHSFPIIIKHSIEQEGNEYEYIYKDFIYEINQIINRNEIYLNYLIILEFIIFQKNILKIRKIKKEIIFKIEVNIIL